jgi:hypothetical protein
MNTPKNQPTKTDRYLRIRELIKHAIGILPDGVSPPNLSDHALAQYVRSPQKLKPLSEAARDMIIGTTLGDGSMGWSTEFPRYSAVHGLEQKDYCQSKFDLIRNYCGGTAPSEADNLGHGDKIVRFSTLTTPVFEFVRYLCYRPDASRPSGLRKAITKELVDQLNWRQTAWFYQDDGSLQTRQMHFSTHDYPREEVELLAAWFLRNGISAKPKQVSKGDKRYWLLVVSTAGSFILADKIRPHMHPSMLRKLPSFENSVCANEACSAVIPSTGHGPQPKFCSEECRKKQDKESRARRRKALSKAEKKERYRRSIELLKEDPLRYSRWREYHAANQKLKSGDGPKAAHHKAWKKSYREKRKSEGRPEKPPQTHKCGYCPRIFQNSLTHKMSPRSPFISCARESCMKMRADDYAELRRARAREKWARDRRSE